jgi:hypothetical protein
LTSNWLDEYKSSGITGRITDNRAHSARFFVFGLSQKPVIISTKHPEYGTAPRLPELPAPTTGGIL